MANTFLRKISNNISSVETSVGNYTVDANIGAVVIGLSISNTNVSQVFANVIINNGTTDYYIIRNGLIPAAGALVVAGGEQKIILQTGDSVQVSASGNVDAVMNVMETDGVGITDDGDGGGTETVISNAWGANDGVWYNSLGDNRVLFFRSSTTEELNNALALLGTGDVFKATTKINEDFYPGTVVQEVTFTVVSVDPGTEFEPVWIIDVTSSVSINADAELDGVIGITIV